MIVILINEIGGILEMKERANYFNKSLQCWLICCLSLSAISLCLLI